MTLYKLLSSTQFESVQESLSIPIIDTTLPVAYPIIFSTILNMPESTNVSKDNSSKSEDYSERIKQLSLILLVYSVLYLMHLMYTSIFINSILWIRQCVYLKYDCWFYRKGISLLGTQHESQFGYYHCHSYHPGGNYCL